ncbi:HlyC/CorC family transporter, partial [Listeria monocytogenes]
IFPVSDDEVKVLFFGLLRVCAVLAGLGFDVSFVTQSILPFISPVLVVFVGMFLVELLVLLLQVSVPFVVLTVVFGGSSGFVSLVDVLDVFVGVLDDAFGPIGFR